ncbi:MAG: Kazal-type serine protease inhibitor [Saprospiraceae bacterium]
MVQCKKNECAGIYAPVCGADGNSYRNACLAKEARNSSFSEGICTIKAAATVRFYGNQSNSKCTWVLETEATDDASIINRWYTPELPDVLKKENQLVRVNFLPNDIAFNCILDGKEALIIYMDLIEIESN